MENQNDCAVRILQACDKNTSAPSSVSRSCTYSMHWPVVVVFKKIHFWFPSFNTMSVLCTSHYHWLSFLTLNAFSLSREVITVQHNVLTAFWQFMSASVLGLLTQRGRSASEQNSPGRIVWDEKKNVEVGLWIAPVYLLKKCVFISPTHTNKLEPLFKQLS